MEKGERGRLRPGDPQAGLSHARQGLADPSPFPGDQEARSGERIVGGIRSWRKSGKGEEARARPRGKLRFPW